jgi:hypothetical protein
MASKSAGSQSAAVAKADLAPLSSLSQGEQYAWNIPARAMTRFHDAHKYDFNFAYEHADDYYKHGMTLRSFLRNAFRLVNNLGGHHSIEEAYIFPLLAEKHPAFQHGAEHKLAHEAIHDGLERYSAFLHESLKDEKSYAPDKLRAILDSFREPLFHHLDQEVQDLGADSLRAHGFTLKDLARLPFH